MAGSGSRNHRVIVVGASAGGVEALKAIAGALPPGLPAAVLVVLHLPADSPSVLPELLARAGPLPARHPADDEPMRPGTIYVAPPDHHLLVAGGRVLLRHGPRENHVRPAIDVLFRSAAVACGPAAVGVVLTGNLSDGTAGLHAIRTHGGTTVVQDPQEASFPSMPSSALREIEVDYCLSLAEIPPLLVGLATSDGVRPAAAAAVGASSVDRDSLEVKIADGSADNLAVLRRIAQPSAYSCPECQGTLWEIRGGDLVRFRCRVGHAFTLEALLTQQDNAVESALFSALRALEERVHLNARMAERLGNARFAELSDRYRQRQKDSERDAALLRMLLQRGIGAEGTK